MPKHVTIQVPVSYPMEFIPLRGAKAREIQVAETLEVKVPVVDRSDVKLRIKARSDNDTFDRYELDGRLYGRVYTSLRLRKAGQFFDPVVQGRFHDEESVTRALFPGEKYLREVKGTKRVRVERPTGVSRVVLDGHDEVVGEAMAVANALFVMDGDLFRPSSAPVFALQADQETRWDSMIENAHLIGKHYRVSLDRRDDLESLMERIQTRGGVSFSRPFYEIERLDWDLSSEKDAANNAFYAVTKVLWGIGTDVARIDHRILKLAAEISEARGSMLDRMPPDPNRIHSALTEIGGLLPPQEYLWLTRNVANALDVIESSRDFVLHRLDEDDVAAIEGMSL